MARERRVFITLKSTVFICSIWTVQEEASLTDIFLQIDKGMVCSWCEQEKSMSELFRGMNQFYFAAVVSLTSWRCVKTEKEVIAERQRAHMAQVSDEWVPFLAAGV